MLFVSPIIFGVNDWKDDDPRIHKDVNCIYKDHRTYLDIIYELIKADMLESDLVKVGGTAEERSERQCFKSKTTMENKLVDEIAEELKAERVVTTNKVHEHIMRRFMKKE